MAAPNLAAIEQHEEIVSLRALFAFVGRLLLSSIFILSGAHKVVDWAGTAQSMRDEGMVGVPIFLGLAILFELGGGLLLLIGWNARIAALLLMVFLIPTTAIFHDFWAHEGASRQMQMIEFMKNTAILGGLCLAFAYGPGAWSFDRGRRRLRG